ncbi:MAG: hypothetical protein EOP88_22790, partial [Verrucomicrobiaceae bacterium]
MNPSPAPDSHNTAASSATAASAEMSPTPSVPAQRPDYIAEKFWKDGRADVESLGRSYQELETAFSRKHPTAADLPKDPTGYQFKPDALPEGVVWVPEIADRFAKVFHDQRIGQTSARAITDAFVQIEAQQVKAASDAYEARLREDRAALVERWGGPDAFDLRRQDIATLVTDKLGADPDDAALFSNPRVVDFLATTTEYVRSLERQLGEDALAAAKGSVAPGHAFTDAKAEATRIMRDAGHPEHESYLRGDAGTVRKVMGLLG